MTTDEVFVLAVEGRLDAVLADRLQEDLVRLIKRGQRAILLDFSKVQQISGPGLRVLLVAGKGSERIGCQFALSGVNESVARPRSERFRSHHHRPSGPTQRPRCFGVDATFAS